METSFSGNTLCSEGYIEEIKLKVITTICLERSSRTSASMLKAYNSSLFKVFISIRIAISPGLHYIGVSLCNRFTENVFCDVMDHHLSSKSPIIDTVLLGFVKD